jgi:adenosine/AMP kinase
VPQLGISVVETIGHVFVVFGRQIWPANI